MTRGQPDFDTAWRTAPAAVRRALALAYEALAAGGLAVGAVLTNADGKVIAEGRNEAYEDGPVSASAGASTGGPAAGPGAGPVRGHGGGPDSASVGGPGNGPLRGTPLAHAEMNALAVARTGWDLGAVTLWSTQEPCSMCAAAAEFTGVGRVRFLAPDPWALAYGHADGSGADPGGQEWLLVANAMFLRSVVLAASPDSPEEPRILTHHRAAEPETEAFHGTLPAGPPTAASLEDWLRPHWFALAGLATARRLRTG
ncbi:tRNA-specific adenosine deaminase [Streptomyces avidinii]